jgi:hypothetical protein
MPCETDDFSFWTLRDHVIIFSEAHLRRILESYFECVHRCRTPLSLAKDCPEPRATVPPESDRVVAFPKVGGWHHFDTREVAWLGVADILQDPQVQ